MTRTPRVDRAGAALPLVAVMLLGILAVLSLAIDLGMAYTARTEAQRVADAAALAGASAYLDHVDPYTAGADVEARAKEYAAINTVRNQPVDTVNDLSVEFLPAESAVRVAVWRRGLPTWFARLLGIDELTVSAVAAAAAVNAGAAKCVRPWAIMDMWEENGGENGCGQDALCDGWWDEGEEWTFDPTQDVYEQAQEIGDPNATGYGSAARDGVGGITNDRGRQITIKAQDPNSEFVVNPGTFLPWQMPDGDGGYMTGAADYRTNIETCNEQPVFLSDDASDPDGMYEYPLEFGNMVGPTFQGVRELIQQDPGAYWDPSGSGSIQGSDYPGLDSPRVIIVGLVDPEQLIGSGSERPTDVRFNNFAMLFLEEQAGTQAPVVARFLYYVNGAGDTGPATGPLVKTLRLIE